MKRENNIPVFYRTTVLLLLVLAIVTAYQSVSIREIKSEQEEAFYIHIASAAYTSVWAAAVTTPSTV